MTFIGIHTVSVALKNFGPVTEFNHHLFSRFYLACTSTFKDGEGLEKTAFCGFIIDKKVSYNF